MHEITWCAFPDDDPFDGGPTDEAVELAEAGDIIGARVASHAAPYIPPLPTRRATVHHPIERRPPGRTAVEYRRPRAEVASGVQLALATTTTARSS